MRKIVSLLLILVITSYGFLSYLLIHQGGVEAETVLYVGGTGPGNYSSIQAAIDEASYGDTVFVYNGTYYGKILIDRTISLIGENKDITIIDGNLSEIVVYIIADNVSISGFTITNGSYPGIKIESKYVTVQDNNISGNWGYGILLNVTSRNNIINSNNISKNEYYGIYMDVSGDNNITNNIISDDHQYGVWLFHSDNNIICNNNISGYDGNTVPYYGNKGIYLKYSSNNIINNNNIMGNGYEGIYLERSSNNNTLDGNIITGNEESGIELVFYNKGNIIKNNKIYGNGKFGIFINWDSSENFIRKNNISQNSLYGIFILSSSNNFIIGNEISRNQQDGIRINLSGKNIISNNKIFENQIYGMSFSSENNVVYHNNIINNTIQAYEFNGNNIWNLSHLYGGNYWSDYNGPDNYSGPYQNLTGSDEIGDTPYIFEGIIDHYPLFNPVFISDTIPTELKVPSAPQNLQARYGYRYVNLTWEEPYYEVGLNIIEYRIYRRTVIDEEILIDTTKNIRYSNDTDVSIGHLYFYTIKAVNAIGESPFSNHISVVPITTPSSPLNMQIVADYNYVNLSWEAPFNNGGSIISNYTIYRGTISGELELLTIIDNTTYYNDTDVYEDSTYFYVISAVNEAGEGTRSNELNITTTLAPVIDEVQNFQTIFLLIFVISVVITAIIAYIILTKKSKTD